MLERRARLLYEYLNVEQKKEVLLVLLRDREKLQMEYDKNKESYPKIIEDVIIDTLDRWDFEIKELEDDIKNNVGSIRTV
ncbi:MAG: hypothetical protein ACI35O_11045 [Bacillaceae bacterium]